MKDLPYVSVVIPNLNNQGRLEKCLGALERQQYPKKCFEVIVVDNGSIDGSVEVAQKFNVKIIIKSERKSPYWCRNAGIDLARGKIIALLDSNCIPEQNWLNSGIEILQELSVAIATGPVHFQFSDNFSVVERLDYLYSVVSAADIDRLTALSAGNLFVNKTVFEQVGLFLPNIRSLGDIDWTSRAYKRGFRFGFADQAIVKYPAKGFISFVKKMIRLGGGRKELWVVKGNSIGSLMWAWKVVKHFSPPSLAFIKDIAYLNRREKMRLNLIQIVVGLWFLKVLRGIGMIFKRVHKN